MNLRKLYTGLALFFLAAVTFIGLFSTSAHAVVVMARPMVMARPVIVARPVYIAPRPVVVARPVVPIYTPRPVIVARPPVVVIAPHPVVPVVPYVADAAVQPAYAQPVAVVHSASGFYLSTLFWVLVILVILIGCGSVIWVYDPFGFGGVAYFDVDPFLGGVVVDGGYGMDVAVYE